jgi:ABC-2 type transport system ATP-binding protein
MSEDVQIIVAEIDQHIIASIADAGTMRQQSSAAPDNAPSPAAAKVGSQPGASAKGGTQPDAAAPRLTRPPNRNAAIDAIGISHTYIKSKFCLEPLDVTVNEGEILSIIGVNGSGKSTLIDILRGALAPSQGVVLYPRLSPNPNDWQTIKSKIGYVPQRSNRWNGTVRENLEYAAAVNHFRGDDNKDNVKYLLLRHGLEKFENETWRSLSSGYRMRFDLALARVHEPRLLILDEPMANLDLL